MHAVWMEPYRPEARVQPAARLQYAHQFVHYGRGVAKVLHHVCGEPDVARAAFEWQCSIGGYVELDAVMDTELRREAARGREQRLIDVETDYLLGAEHCI